MTSYHAPFFFVEPSSISKEIIHLGGTDARHLASVRRASPGDLISVSDGAGRIFEVRITAVGEGEIHGRILTERSGGIATPRLSVFQGLAKGTKVELAVQKLVEVGVAEVVVFVAGRSAPRWDEKRGLRALERWRTIAREAAKQSHQPFLPEVLGPLALSEVPPMLEERAPSFVAHISAAKSLRSALPAEAPPRMALVVGPEGGLSGEELASLSGTAQAVSLGPRVLRSETAGLVAASAIQFHYGNLG